MHCPFFTLEPHLSNRELHSRAQRTLNTTLTPTAQARLQRLASHPNADLNLKETIARRLRSSL